MAREKMITRTITETTVSVMGVNVADAKVDYADIKIAGEFTDNDAIMKHLKKHYETDNYKIVNIISVDTVDKLYGMPESEFIALAKVLPPRGTTADNETETE